MTNLWNDSPPPRLAPGALRVFAAGGLGEIGRNMTLFQFGGESLIVDCGVLFPSDSTPGVDLILPDLDIIQRSNTQPQFVVLTHGHEDHIGAIPYLVRRYPDITILGTDFTLALVRARLGEHGLNPKLIEFHDNETVQLGDFEVTPIAVAHSVPEGVGLIVRVAGWTVLHTGDFKIDAHPLDSRPTDLRAFEIAGSQGIDLLLSDSTNAEVEDGVFSESDITSSLNAIFRSTIGRMIFACFASNVHRVQQAVNAAVLTNRAVCFTGRSMIRNMGIAQERGLLQIPDGVEVSFNDAIALDPKKVALICTGSQGEPLAALARISRGEHKIKVSSEDTIILSARFIPGNESDIFRVINGLSERGARVLHRDNALVHASGHAGAADLKRVLRAARPRYLMPVHGEWRHLQAHGNLANSVGINSDQVMLMGNGDVLDLVQGAALIVGSYGHQDIYVDGTTVGHIGSRTFKDRTLMSDGGLIQIILVIDTFSNHLIGTPHVLMRGVANAGSVSAEIQEIAVKRVREWATGIPKPRGLEDELRGEVRRAVKDVYGLQPLITCTVVQVPTP